MASQSETALWGAIQSYARSISAAPVKSVLMFGDDGSGFALFPNGRREPWGEETPCERGAWPPQTGWAFRTGEASYNGRSFRIGGLRRHLLLALADRPGEPVPDRLVKMKTWGDPWAEDERLKDLVYQLRMMLRRELSLPAGEDIILRVDGGYCLTLGNPTVGGRS